MDTATSKSPAAASPKAMILRAIRTCTPAEGKGKHAHEKEIVMFSLYNSSQGELLARCTPAAMVRVLAKYIGEGKFDSSTPLWYYYKHGAKPEGVRIDVGRWMRWLQHNVVPLFEKARKDMASNANEANEGDDTPPTPANLDIPFHHYKHMMDQPWD